MNGPVAEELRSFAPALDAVRADRDDTTVMIMEVEMISADLRFAVYGGPRVWRDGVELDIGSPQRRTLLALLLAAGGDAVPFTEITTALWDSEPPPSAANAVHRLVGQLRRLLEPELGNREIGDWLTPVGLGYRLVVDATRCDLLRLRELVDQGDQ